MKIIAYFLVKINLVIALMILFAVGSVNAQTFPDGLIGSSDSDPAVLFSIDASTGTATPIVTLDVGASITGLTFLQGTLYGSDLCSDPECDVFFIGSISTLGNTTFLSNQNGSFNWQGLGSDEAGGVMYSIDINNSDILTAQFPDGSVQTIGSGTGIDGRGIEFDDTHGILYAADETRLYTISTVTGTSNFVGSFNTEISNAFGLAYDECNQILYLNDGKLGQLFTLDVNTGAATLVGSNGVQALIDGLAWKGPCGLSRSRPIPTLSEWGLITAAAGLGLVGVLFAVRRRRARTVV